MNKVRIVRCKFKILKKNESELQDTINSEFWEKKYALWKLTTERKKSE